MGQSTFSGPVVSQNGFIDASFTDAERDAIVDPQAGLLIYNTTSNTYEVYSGSSWDTAFGGGGAGSFPYMIANGTATSVFSTTGSNKAGPITFNNTGTQAIRIESSMGTFPTIATLSTPYALSSQTAVQSLAENYLATGTPVGGFFNAQGTTFSYCCGSGSSLNYAVYTLATPFDATTGTFTIGGGLFNAPGMGSAITAANISNDGTKLIVTNYDMAGSTYVSELSLGTPYDLSTTNATPVSQYTITSTINAAFATSQTYGCAFNSTGTVAFIPGMSFVTPMPAPVILELKLTTPFSLASIESTYVAAITVPSYYVTFNLNNAGVTLLNGKVVFGFTDGMQNWYGTSDLIALAAPKITSVSPSAGVKNTPVTINGSGLNFTTDVKFGGVSVGGFTTSETSISTNVPALPASGLYDVEVTTVAGSAVKSNAFNFTYVAPSLTYPVSYAFVSANTPAAEFPYTFSPDGMKYTTSDTSKTITTYQLNTPWDIASYTGSPSSISLDGYIPSNVTLGAGVAWNSNGTKLFVLGNQWNGSEYNSFIYELQPSSPYKVNTIDPSSVQVNTFAVGSTVSSSGLTFNDTGTKLFITDSSGNLKMYQLSSAYNVASITSTPTLSVNVSMMFGLPSNPVQVSFSSAGLIGFLGSNGSSGKGGLTQFSMATPFNINSIENVQSIDLGTICDSVYASNATAYLGQNDSSMFINLYDPAYMAKMYKFSVTG